MTIQEQIINQENGTEYWKIYFEFQSIRPLTRYEWDLIQEKINIIFFEIQKQTT